MFKEINSGCPKAITERSPMPMVQASLEDGREMLQRLIASRNTMLCTSSAAWWSKNGDKVNKQFFIIKSLEPIVATIRS